MRSSPEDRLILPLLPEGRLLVGLSGGCDSMALLLLLHHAGRDITAVHVNHGMRGEASDGDEAFVRRVCREKGVPLIVHRAYPAPDASEDDLRRLRYSLFAEAMAESHAAWLVLAHHREDQAETLLLHLLRGAGLQGLCGMEPETVVMGIPVLRPLLNVSKQALREYLTAAGQNWREDGSNQDTAYTRNAIRHQVMPLLESIQPQAAAHLASAAALLQPDWQMIREQAEDFLNRFADGESLPILPLTQHPEALQKHILRFWWDRNHPEAALTREQTERLTALLHAPSGTRCNLPGTVTGYRGYHRLHLVKEGVHPTPAPVPVKGEEIPFGSLTLRIGEAAETPGDGKRFQRIPAGLLAGCELRCRRQGDFIRPFGQMGQQSLQDYFVNRHIDAPFRDRIPLVCRGSEVLMAAGIGCGAIPRTQSPEGCLTLQWQGAMPWLADQ